MTVIYVDTLFLLNAGIDYLLLLASARLAGEPLRRWRFGAGAILGGLYAVAIFLPGLGFLGHPLCRVACVAMMLLLAYGKSQRLLRQGMIFLGLTCAFAGGVVAIGMMGGQGLALGSSGVVYSSLDLKMVLLSAAVCYVILSVVFQRIGKHHGGSGGLVHATLTVGERVAELTALVDTGNTLTDPVSGRAVMVAEWDSLNELFPCEHRPTPLDLQDPAGAMTRLGTGEWKGRFRLLSYRSVGVERGLLLALRVDGVKLGQQEQGALLVALSPTPVSDGGGYRALIGALDGKE